MVATLRFEDAIATVEINSPATKLMLLGGAVCLDFTNTTEHRPDHPEYDFLARYLDLVAWSRHAGVLSDQQAHVLVREAEARSDEAETVLIRALSLRAAIYRIFAARANGDPIPAADLAVLQPALTGALAHTTMVATEAGFTWGWADERALDRMLWPIARSAADLLTSTTAISIQACGGCGWLFLDTSRNGSRRWCDMRFCGNRAKRQRSYQRSVAARGTTQG